MTTTQQLEISVLSAPLAAIDRRSLSQAWYSALHLAGDGSAPRGSLSRAAIARGRQAPASAAPERSLRAAPAVPATVKSPQTPPLRAGGLAERRTARSPLARRIESALFERTAARARTTFAIGEGSGRVVVVLHASGGRVRLVALCSPTLRRTVARALDQARFALAARGITLEGGVLDGAATCS